MSDKTPDEQDATESLIESLHAARQKRSLVLNPDYLDDEKLPEEERAAVLREIFNRKIREKQIGRIISHITPILDGIHPPPALIFGPTGSGKTVTLIHVLSTFQRVAEKRGIGFRYYYIDLTSPKTFFRGLKRSRGRPGSAQIGNTARGFLLIICRPGLLRPSAPMMGFFAC